MAYTIDKNLEKGMKLLESPDKVEEGLELVNSSAKTGTTRGKSFFIIGELIRQGKYGIQADLEKSRSFYDRAAEFLLINSDSMDYLYLGDYFNYGLGTHPANKQKALEYYELSAASNDSIQPIAELRIDDLQKTLDELGANNELNQNQLDGADYSNPDEDYGGNSNASFNHNDQFNNEFGFSQDDNVDEEYAKENSLPFENVSNPNVPNNTPLSEPTSNSFSTPSFAKPIRNENAPYQDLTNNIDSGFKDEVLLIKALKLLDSPASSLQDKIDGFELVRTSCDEGSVRAAVLLGYFYEGKTSIKDRNLADAIRYYELAVSRGSVVAEFRLGLLYLIQNTPFTNEDKGHNLILSSARKGYSFALNYLGDCFREKVLDPRNLSLAYRYYALAGERNLGVAYHNMAEIDASRQDIELATQHEEYAKKLGYDPSQSPYDSLANVLHF